MSLTRIAFVELLNKVQEAQNLKYNKEQGEVRNNYFEEHNILEQLETSYVEHQIVPMINDEGELLSVESVDDKKFSVAKFACLGISKDELEIKMLNGQVDVLLKDDKHGISFNVNNKDYDEETTIVKLENGILTITMAEAESAKAIKLEIS